MQLVAMEASVTLVDKTKPSAAEEAADNGTAHEQNTLSDRSDVQPLKASGIQRALHPWLLTLKILCLHPSYGYSPSASHLTKITCCLSLALGVLAIAVDWFNVIRYLFAYQGSRYGPRLFVKVVRHAFYLHVAVSTTLLITKSRHIANLIRLWQSIHTEDLKLTKRLRWLSITCAVTLIPLFFISNWSLYAKEPQARKNAEICSLPFRFNTSNEKEVHIARCVLTIMHACLGCQAFGCLLFLTIFCIGITGEFRKLNSDMQTAVSDEPPGDQLTLSQLKSFRERHVDLCRLVRHLDDIVCGYAMSTFVTITPVICFSIYITFHTFSTLIKHFAFVLSTVTFMLFFLVVLLVVGATLAEHTTLCKSILQDIKIPTSSKISIEYQVELSLFLSKVTSGPIGLTAWKMFPVNKSTCNAVVLFIISYAAVLLRFGNKESQQVPASNCTCT